MPKEITKELIGNLYVKEKKSLREIGNLLNKVPTQISRYLKKFNIQARPFSTKGLQIRLGAILSEATKDKISKAHLGKKLSPEHRAKVIKTLRYGLKGKNNPNWKGGKSINGEGYILTLTKNGYKKEHRIVMENYLNRKLNKEEHIHHLNGNKSDNRIENLLLVSNSQHQNIEWDNEAKKKQSNKIKKIRSENFWSTRKIIK